MPERLAADNVLLGLCLIAIDQGWAVWHNASGTWSFRKGETRVDGKTGMPGQFASLVAGLEANGFDAGKAGKSKRPWTSERMRGLIAEALDQHWSVRRRGDNHVFVPPGSNAPVTGSDTDFVSYRALTGLLTAAGLELGAGSVTIRMDSGQHPRRARPRRQQGTRGRSRK